MCCLLATLLFLGPRAGIVVWWFVDADRWRASFDDFFIPALGFLVLPWTTLAWVLVAPNQQLVGTDWAWIIGGVVADLVMWSGPPSRRRLESFGW